MINQQTLQGNWNELKGQLRKHWGQLTDDDVSKFDGNVDQLVGLIQRKTGEGREAIEKYLDQLSSSSSSTLEQAGQTARDYAQRAAQMAQERFPEAAEQFRHGYERASQQVQQGWQQAEEQVRARPVESLAVMFAAGALAGLTLGLMLRSR